MGCLLVLRAKAVLIKSKWEPRWNEALHILICIHHEPDSQHEHVDSPSGRLWSCNLKKIMSGLKTILYK